MFSWFRSRQRTFERIGNSSKHEPDAYCKIPGTDDHQKKQYYEVIAWAAAACQSGVSDPNVEGVLRARASAEAALKVVKLREQFVTGTIILRN